MDKTVEETKRCPSCDEVISSKAKRCPHCRQDLRGWFRRHPILTILLVLITSPFWIAISVGAFQGFTSSFKQNIGDQGKSETPASIKQNTFIASVNFTGTEFVISNLDAHVCQNSKMQVNDDYSLDGYTLESGLDTSVKSGQVQVYKVGAGQFTKKDGTRLNPFTTKPQKFYIECRGNNELSSAYWYGEFQ